MFINDVSGRAAKGGGRSCVWWEAQRWFLPGGEILIFLGHCFRICFKNVFLQAGSHDFETNSDSLYWELEHGWTGLLVEPHPLSFSFGVSK